MFTNTKFLYNPIAYQNFQYKRSIKHAKYLKQFLNASATQLRHVKN